MVSALEVCAQWGPVQHRRGPHACASGAGWCTPVHAFTAPFHPAQRARGCRRRRSRGCAHSTSVLLLRWSLNQRAHLLLCGARSSATHTATHAAAHAHTHTQAHLLLVVLLHVPQLLPKLGLDALHLGLRGVGARDLRGKTACTHMRVHVCMHTCVRVYMCARVCVCAHLYVGACVKNGARCWCSDLAPTSTLSTYRDKIGGAEVRSVPCACASAGVVRSTVQRLQTRTRTDTSYSRPTHFVPMHASTWALHKDSVLRTLCSVQCLGAAPSRYCTEHNARSTESYGNHLLLNAPRLRLQATA